MKRSLFISLLVFSIIFLTISISPVENKIIDKNEIFVQANSPYIIKFLDFGGYVKITTSNKNITITLDGKSILPDEWFSTGHIGIHTIVINSSQNIDLVLTLSSTGTAVQIPILFGILLAFSIAGILLTFRKNKKQL